MTKPKGQTPDAWRAAHRRLYEYLCKTTDDHQPDTLAEMQPLYQAVAHGCQAELQAETLRHVYQDRILRGTGPGGFYSSKRLGAIGADLGAVACFFDTPWTAGSRRTSRPSDQAWLLNEAASRLRALGRLTEAVEPTRVAMEREAGEEHWKKGLIG